ncbi:MAG: (2Fe-2S)-binding protein [Gemmatimonadota bacterium]|jgi:aerobic-type carbon monoxide dehydrogenase small subunit (CoxS/CutS family)
MLLDIQFTLNGKPTEINVDPRRKLLWVLRSDLGMTGTKYGCGEAHCAACTVLVDGEPTYSCMMPVSGVAGREVTTIEGLADGDKLHPVQQAFVDHDAMQCGYCTSGMIVGAYGLLQRTPDPTEDEIRAGLEGHLCRCGTHVRVLEAVQTAARAMKGGTR